VAQLFKLLRNSDLLLVDEHGHLWVGFNYFFDLWRFRFEVLLAEPVVQEVVEIRERLSRRMLTHRLVDA